MRSSSDSLSSREERAEVHRLRAYVLEAAVRLEGELDVTLAMRLGRDLEAVVSLVERVLWRPPIHERVNHLREFLSEVEAALRPGAPVLPPTFSFPFVLPVMEKIFEARNNLVHGLVDTTESTSDWLVVVRRKKGGYDRVRYQRVALWDLVNQTPAVLNELEDVGRIFGGLELYGDVHGYSER